MSDEDFEITLLFTVALVCASVGFLAGVLF